MSNIDKFNGGNNLPAVIQKKATTQVNADFEYAR